MTIVSVIKCDEPSCGLTILESSATRVNIKGIFYVTIGSSSVGKLDRLDFCDKSCCKKYFDDFGL